MAIRTEVYLTHNRLVQCRRPLGVPHPRQETKIPRGMLASRNDVGWAQVCFRSALFSQTERGVAELRLPVNPAHETSTTLDQTMQYKFTVSDIRQCASGDSTVIKYLAELTTFSGDGNVTVRVLSTIPVTAAAYLLEAACEFVRLGAQDVLREYQLDGELILSDVLIHDVDCIPLRFRSATAAAIRELLVSQ